MYTSKDVRDAAHLIKPYLPHLVGTDKETVESALEELLTRDESDLAVDNEILALLAERDSTREWTHQFLKDKTPPPVMRNYDPLPGSVSVIDANTFVCKVSGCPSIWYRPKAGMEPPLCKEHQIPLVPAQS